PRNVHLLLSTQDAIIEGMSVSLKCDNDASPPADVYTWYWNKQRLQETSKILQLKKIQVDQSGSYHCKTSNSISEQESPPMGITASLFCWHCIIVHLIMYGFYNRIESQCGVVVKSDRLVIWGTGSHLRSSTCSCWVTLGSSHLFEVSQPHPTGCLLWGRKGKENVSRFETPSGSDKAGYQIQTTTTGGQT
uniref:Ig-like domain-containing protein n=1 Tax=Podarcis muralis TaxID=64176 RepID=A0A670IJ15_PODMU